MTNLRAMDRLVKQERFKTAYNLDPTNTRIIFAIQSGDIEAVEDWIADTLSTELELGEYNLRQLRAKAAQLGIPYFATFSKDELLVRVAHVLRGQETAGTVSPVTQEPADRHCDESAAGLPAATCP